MVAVTADHGFNLHLHAPTMSDSQKPTAMRLQSSRYLLSGPANGEALSLPAFRRTAIPDCHHKIRQRLVTATHNTARTPQRAVTNILRTATPMAHTSANP